MKSSPTPSAVSPVPLPSAAANAAGHSFFRLFDYIDESFFYLDAELRLIYLNKAGSVLLRRVFHTVLARGQCVMDMLPPERHEAFAKHATAAMEGREVSYETLAPDGRTWVRCRFFPYRSEDGQVIGFYGLIKDITAQKEVGVLAQKAETMQRDLFASRNLFEKFMENSPLVAWLIDNRGHVHYMNPVCLKLCQLSAADLGRSIYQLLPAQMAIDLHLSNQRVLELGEPVEAIEKIGMKVQRVFKTYKFPLLVNEKAMVGGWAVDITDQVELQETLIKSIERHEYANEATSDIVYDCDCDAAQLYHSSRFEEHFGGGGQPRSLRQLARLIHPDDVEAIRSTVFDSLRNPAIDRWQIEYRLRSLSGGYRTVLDKAFIIRRQHKVSRVIGALQDITDQKALQKKLLEQERRNKREVVKSIIETQEKERRQLSVELHDNVNQILASCKLMLDVAREGGPPAATLIEKSYQSIQSVIDEIRRISHDLNPSALTDVGLAEAVAQLVETVNLSGKLQVSFCTHGTANLSALAEEDRIAVFRIVQEQLSNILKHAGASHVAIRIGLYEGLLRLSVKDDGVGFTLADVKKGLGLRNIRNRVDYYNGTLEFMTAKGQGCQMVAVLKIKLKTASVNAPASSGA